MHRLAIIPILILSAWALPVPSAAAAPELDLEAAIGRVRAKHEREVQAAAAALGARRGLSTAGARNHLETRAVYNELNTVPIRVDWKEIAMPPKPPAAVLAAVGRYSRGYFYRMKLVEEMIAKDEAFLRQPGNNTDNTEYVKKRLAALRRMRAQVARGVMDHAQAMGDLGDSVMGAHGGWSFDKLKERAERTGKAIGQAPASQIGVFDKALAGLRDSQRRDAHRARAELMHREMKSAAASQGASGGDYVVVVIRIQRESYGGYGVLVPGRETELSIRDTYSIVKDTKAKMDARMARWRELYEHGWCRSHHDAPEVSRSTLTFVVSKAGMSSQEAGDLKTGLGKRMQGSGARYTNTGWSGPGNRLSVPFTVPGKVRSIRSCSQGS